MTEFTPEWIEEQKNMDSQPMTLLIQNIADSVTNSIFDITHSIIHAHLTINAVRPREHIEAGHA